MKDWNNKIGNEGAEVKQIWLEVKATFLYNVISFYAITRHPNMLKLWGLGLATIGVKSYCSRAIIRYN
ncbi:hypothetical protein COP2_029378 [Malus domestica]